MIVDGPTLDAAALAEAVRSPWRAPLVLDEVGSTNSVAAEAARAGEPEGFVVVARRQTAGRGRLDRTWHSPPGSGLTFSVLLRPSRPPDEFGWLPLITGLAVLDAVREAGASDAFLKWPNDVKTPTGKLAGILAEAVAGAVLIGVGVNLAETAGLPEGAASLDAADPTLTLVALLTGIGGCYLSWLEDAAPIQDRYRSGCATLGRPVRVDLPGGRELIGTATRIDHLGRLVVDSGGKEHSLASGDVVHLR